MYKRQAPRELGHEALDYRRAARPHAHDRRVGQDRAGARARARAGPRTRTRARVHVLEFRTTTCGQEQQRCMSPSQGRDGRISCAVGPLRLRCLVGRPEPWAESANDAQRSALPDPVVPIRTTPPGQPPPHTERGPPNGMGVGGGGTARGMGSVWRRRRWVAGAWVIAWSRLRCSELCLR